MITDLFAGPGGWDEGLRMLGIHDVLGIEWEPNACATAEAAGHRRMQADVAALDPNNYPCTGLIASPPCQAWSMAGKRKGELDRANCHTLADRMADGDDSLDWCEWEDARSPLVCQPVRWVRELRPEWVALEEVPAVASLWEHFARIFRAWGYSVWAGGLNAADYGVPQTRTRRILIANRTRTVGPPPPKHSRKSHGLDLFGEHTRPWVTMAEALGWDGLVGFPRRAVTDSNRTASVLTVDGADYRARDMYPTDGPAQTVTEKTRSWHYLHPGERPPVYVNGNQPNAGRRSIDEPAPTVQFGHRSNDVRWVGVDAVRTNQGNPRDGYYERSTDEPAPTLTSQLRSFRWVAERPATTVVGSFRPDVIAGPGHHNPSRQNAPGSVRVSVQEAAILQSFPADYPWQGSRTRQFEQIGNAIPPLLAAHVLAATIGTTPPTGDQP